MPLSPEQLGAAIGSIIAVVGAAAGALVARKPNNKRCEKETERMLPCEEHGEVCEKLGIVLTRVEEIQYVNQNVNELRGELKEFYAETRKLLDEAFKILRTHEGSIGRLQGSAEHARDWHQG